MSRSSDVNSSINSDVWESSATDTTSHRSFGDFDSNSVIGKKEKKAAQKQKKEEKKKKRKLAKKKKKNKISKEDFFNKHLEFQFWLLNEKKIILDDTSPAKQKEYFKKFVNKWNSRRLQEKYYRGIDTLWAVGTPNTQTQWAMPQDVMVTPGSLPEDTLVSRYARTSFGDMGTFTRKAGLKALRELQQLNGAGELAITASNATEGETQDRETKKLRLKNDYPVSQTLHPKENIKHVDPTMAIREKRRGGVLQKTLSANLLSTQEPKYGNHFQPKKPAPPPRRSSRLCTAQSLHGSIPHLAGPELSLPPQAYHQSMYDLSTIPRPFCPLDVQIPASADTPKTKQPHMGIAAVSKGNSENRKRRLSKPDYCSEKPASCLVSSKMKTSLHVKSDLQYQMDSPAFPTPPPPITDLTFDMTLDTPPPRFHLTPGKSSTPTKL